MVRAKLQLNSITQHSYSKELRTLHFDAVHDTSTPENERFTKYTPSGHFDMTVDNPEALAQFELGVSYYVDFTPVPTKPGSD